MATILVINGPNLNLLGTREPQIYGSKTLPAIMEQLAADASKLGYKLLHFQSNSESDLVETIQQAQDKVDFIIINPAALTHTSIALRDALLAVAIPFIEVHLSNPQAREKFRAKSYFSDIAVGTICGFADFGYELALLAATNQLNKRT